MRPARCCCRLPSQTLSSGWQRMRTPVGLVQNWASCMQIQLESQIEIQIENKVRSCSRRPASMAVCLDMHSDQDKNLRGDDVQHFSLVLSVAGSMATLTMQACCQAVLSAWLQGMQPQAGVLHQDWMRAGDAARKRSAMGHAADIQKFLSVEPGHALPTCKFCPTADPCVSYTLEI